MARTPVMLDVDRDVTLQMASVLTHVPGSDMVCFPTVQLPLAPLAPGARVKCWPGLDCCNDSGWLLAGWGLTLTICPGVLSALIQTVS